MPTSLDLSDFLPIEENNQNLSASKKKSSPEQFRNKVVSTLLNWYSYLIKHHPRKSIRVDILPANTSPILPNSSYTAKPRTTNQSTYENISFSFI